jgi:hypothetical protein
MEKEQSFDIDKHRREHLLQYFLLVAVFIFSVSILVQLDSFVYRLGVIIFISAFYFAWGIWHHWEEKNLTRVHFFEYLAISTLIFLVLFFVFTGR